MAGLPIISLKNQDKLWLAERGPVTPIVLRLQVFLGNLGQAVHPTCRAATQNPAVGLAAIYTAAPGNRAASPTPQPVGFLAVTKYCPHEAEPVGDSWS